MLKPSRRVGCLFSANRSRRPAFTQVELLVAIAVLGMLAAFSLPAIQRIRVAVQRLQCAHNMRQLGIAGHAYHDAYGRLPVGCTMPYARPASPPSIADASGIPPPELLYDLTLLDSPARRNSDPIRYPWGPNWAVYLLPFIDQAGLYIEARVDDYMIGYQNGNNSQLDLSGTVTGIVNGTPVTGILNGTTGIVNGTPVTGIMNGTTGIVNGTPVTGTPTGTPVTGILTGTPVTGATKGTTGATKGTPVTGILKGTTVTGIPNGNTVTGIVNGTPVTGILDGTAVTGIPNGTTVTSVVNGTTVTGILNGTTVTTVTSTLIGNIELTPVQTASDAQRDYWRSVVKDKVIPSYVCPADVGNVTPFEGYLNSAGPWARGNYAANAGPGWWQMSLNGASYTETYGLTGPVIGINYGAVIHRIPDGSSNTILFTEVRVGVGKSDPRGVWALGYPGSSITAANAIGDCPTPNDRNETSDDVQGCPNFYYPGIGTRDRIGCNTGFANLGWPSWQAQSRSMHGTGVNVCFADGTVRFIPNTIAQGVWFSMLSANDGAAIDLTGY